MSEKNRLKYNIEDNLDKIFCKEFIVQVAFKLKFLECKRQNTLVNYCLGTNRISLRGLSSIKESIWPCIFKTMMRWLLSSHYGKLDIQKLISL